MNFTISQNDLLAELTRLSGVSEAKSTIPVLQTVLIDLNGSGALHLSATNLDLSMQTSAAIGMISTPGASCLPARKLLEIAKALPKGSEIEFSINAEKAYGADVGGCQIKSGRSKFKLATFSKNDFPEIKEAPSTWITLPAGLWQAMVERVSHAITNEESRYALNGAKMLIAKGELKLIATDGHRLAYVESKVDTQTIVDSLIPKKALIESAKLAEGAKEIQCAVDGDSIFWKVGERILSSRTLSGQFPNWEMVLPKENHNAVTVNKESLFSAVRRCSLMADERSHAVKLVIKENSIEITAQSSESGEAADIVSCDYTGPEITTGFNGTYLLESLSVIDTEKAVMKFKDGMSQAEINPGEGGQIGTRLILMPMRL